MRWPERSDVLGALPIGPDRTRFVVWAPRARRVELELDGRRRLALEPVGEDGHHETIVDECPPGTRYTYHLDGGPALPDPASRRQPDGVHGPSAVVDPGAFRWHDKGWRGLPLEDLVLYELHVGTYTEAGTFAAATEHFEDLRALGVTCIELMPVAAFSGHHNWGYDGVFPFAAQEDYGGPSGLNQLVDSAHRHGLAVCLDVVYNHLGPEGNVLAQFAPYFTDRYKTPWGAAPNLDGPGSDEVRRYFIENARHWITEHHIDALRLDAVHAIVDPTPRPFLEELASAVHERAESHGRLAHVISESDTNDPRLVRPAALGGYGHDAVWSDDFHHALHAVLTGENLGYYADFGALDQLGRALRHAFVYTGERSQYRGRRQGADPAGVPPQRFVVFAQNHDQVGNRADGARLTTLVSADKARLAAGTVLLSPFLPLLFMGDEHGETRPFHFFVDHQDSTLVDAVRRGRRQELTDFGWRTAPQDPADPATFAMCKIDHARRRDPAGVNWWRFHQALLLLRRDIPAIGPHEGPHAVHVDDATATIGVTRTRPAGSGHPSSVWLIFHYGPGQVRARPPPSGAWSRRFTSVDTKWGASGAAPPEHLVVRDAAVVDPVTAAEGVPLGPWSFAVYVRDTQGGAA